MAFNLSMPLALGGANGKIKVGAKLSSKVKNSDKSGGEVWGWDGDDDLIMKGFELDIEGDKYMDGNYVHTHGINVDKIRDHMSANIGSVNEDGDLVYEILPLYEDAILETWDATEDISAFYGMVDMRMGKINFIGGARMEQTSTEYSSWEGNVEDAEDAEYDNIPKTLDSFFVAQKVSKEYTDVLPMAHIRYAMNGTSAAKSALAIVSV
jgi:hypothetical protein